MSRSTYVVLLCLKMFIGKVLVLVCIRHQLTSAMSWGVPMELMLQNYLNAILWAKQTFDWHVGCASQV